MAVKDDIGIMLELVTRVRVILLEALGWGTANPGQNYHDIEAKAQEMSEKAQQPGSPWQCRALDHKEHSSLKGEARPGWLGVGANSVDWKYWTKSELRSLGQALDE